MYTKAPRAFIPLLVALWLTPLGAAADVKVLFDSNDPTQTIFPSNLFTDIDLRNKTFRRVDLPKPDCTVQPVICEDIDVLNTLDGFNSQPRISIPFSGPIDVSTVNSDTVFLVSLGSTSGRGSFREKVGINQIVWDPETNTLHVESDDLLEQHTRYAVVVTRGVRDTAGKPVGGELFEQLRQRVKSGKRKHYHDDLEDALRRLRRDGVVALSVFTTLSTTATLEKIHDQIKRSRSSAVDFTIGNGGTVRSVFPVSAVTGITVTRQTTTAPAFAAPAPLAVAALQLVPGAVGTVAFGKFTSPNYLAPGEFIPTVGTRFGKPEVQQTEELYFNLFVPAGAKPAGGWPVAIFGHGFGSNKDAAPFVLAAKMAEQGVATIAINVVGHGQGPLGTMTISTAEGAVTIPAGGRGIDQNGDTAIATTEGSSAAAPRSLLGSTDALRQTAVDLMQLTHQLRRGVDFDGDGSNDFNRSRIYYFGQSFGGIYGAMFLAVEPSVRVGVPNVAGGPTIDIIRFSPVFRPLFLQAVVQRGLANAAPPVFANENFPLRDQPPVTNTVAGAMAIQQFIDTSEWASLIGNPVSYAPHLRKDPLPGSRPKSIIFQFAKGDMTVPNPTSTSIIRAGDFTDRTSYFRNDLAFAANPATPINPHTFLTNVGAGGLGPVIALQAQEQIATFFASDGTNIIDPDGAAPFFEVPIAGPLPEGLNFITP